MSPHPRTSATTAHRVGTTTVTVRGADGAPRANAPVTVEQTRHQFGFGNIGFDLISLANGEAKTPERVYGGTSIERATALAPLWLGLFDTATLPFYWRGFEPERGHPETDRILAAARVVRRARRDRQGPPAPVAHPRAQVADAAERRGGRGHDPGAHPEGRHRLRGRHRPVGRDQRGRDPPGLHRGGERGDAPRAEPRGASGWSSSRSRPRARRTPPPGSSSTTSTCPPTTSTSSRSASPRGSRSTRSASRPTCTRASAARTRSGTSSSASAGSACPCR